MDAEDEGRADIEGLKDAFRTAAQSSRWRDIVGYEMRERGTKGYWRDARAAIVFGSSLKVRPIYLKDGRTRSPIVGITVRAAYPNVFGYGSQIIRGIRSLGQQLTSNERQAA